ncbi:unnamed protein product [Zymoseptoria tritici ST99CH_1A5]|uniref:F-box domain-containing protein n=1 Tax=Zymoseptoria tritici ST99CH_1A5 TaxID=1276529 RepID=A0A1Y6LSR7_ZYMTR|nr:unnamed protein product [Zymoseptoria tritici ST99CH_3D1]SMY27463.1 unnamed protein product [Zymoseptoria tritici ST99CH_1A5]
MGSLKRKRNDDADPDLPQDDTPSTASGAALTDRQHETDLCDSPPPAGPALFRLPQDLQNTIYGMVLQDVTFTYQQRDHLLPKEPPLVMTCKHIYTKSLELFYANASFVFGHFRRLTQWKVPQRLQLLVQHKMIYDLIDWNEGGGLALDNYESICWHYGPGCIEKQTSLKWKFGRGRSQISRHSTTHLHLLIMN